MHDVLAKIRRVSAALLASAGLTLVSPALAEMGKAPVGPGGVYGGFTVGYAHSDEPETKINTRAPSVTILEIDPDGGLLGGLHFGHVHSGEFLGLEQFRGRVSHNFLCGFCEQ